MLASIDLRLLYYLSRVVVRPVGRLRCRCPRASSFRPRSFVLSSCFLERRYGDLDSFANADACAPPALLRSLLLLLFLNFAPRSY